jgi:hypothetical protein
MSEQKWWFLPAGDASQGECLFRWADRPWKRLHLSIIFGGDMKLRSMTLALGVILLVPFTAFGAVFASCSDFPAVIIPDGTNYRGIADGYTYLPGGLTASFAFAGFAGHSYAVEVADPMENSNIIDPFSVELRAGHNPSHGDQCHAPLVTGIVNTSATDPSGSMGNFTRLSFIAPATYNDATHGYFVNVINADAAPHYLNIRVTDTTLYNPRWSTTENYITVYGFLNTTNQTIHGTLTVNVTFGSSAPATITYSLNGDAGLAPGTQMLVAIGPGRAINMIADQGGWATLAHDGPPGGLTVDGYFSNSSSLVPVVFEPRNSQH